MTYKEALDFMYKALPMYQRVGKAAYKKDLTNTVQLCAALNNPQNKFKSIHIAGTNGKGSTSHMLASVLQSAGYKVGLYTSPHLKSFTERIRVNGEEVSESFVTEFITQNEALIKKVKPSFFEMTVAMAFQYFANNQVDIAVVEVGLGGRLDSTNIIQPELSIITHIGMDHTDMLGDTLAKIAFEKAGIIKDNTPVVISEKHQETLPVFQTVADAKKAPITFAEDISFPERPLSDLQGIYQVKNIKGVLAAIQILVENGWQISTEHTMLGLSQVQTQTGLKGRWQQLNSNPLIICDTGHNKEAFEYIVEQISTCIYDRLFMVLGFVKEKDLTPILEMLPKEAELIFCEPKVQRALLLEELKSKTSFLKQKTVYVQDVNESLAYAKNEASPNDMIFVGGSTFVVAEIQEL